jgi:hypothetical protein
VLDSYALIGYLENEPFSNQVETILRAAREGKSRLYLHVINGDVAKARRCCRSKAPEVKL